MRAADFDYPLPDELIAQRPAPRRDESRLLVLDRASGQIAHRSFRDIVNYLRSDDLLVLNNSRVIHARLQGANASNGGEIEVLLLRENATNDWWVMLRPGRRARIGTKIILTNTNAQPRNILGSVVEQNEEGHRRLLFTGTTDIGKELQSLGEVPLPPYIERTARNNLAEDEERYQTIYASVDGSVAAPTAGLHFTDDLLKALRAKGVQVCFVTLHVGLGTFAPVKADILSAHRMHAEDFVIPPDTAISVNDAKQNGRRVVAVGTTTVRVLENAARHDASITAGGGQTCLFIHPPFRFQIVEVLLTNFHLPRSTLLMLASAFAAPGETRGRDLLLCAYAEAVRAKYRFFSYGDAMLII